MKENLYQAKEEFLKEWPFSRVQKMTLEEYTNLDKTSFCYWLEAKTSNLGSIWGGSAYKFGIYKRRDISTSVAVGHRITDGEYAWFEKYGRTRSDAFLTIKAKLISIIDNVQNNELEKIDDVDLGDAYKWKIAFLYGNFNVINIFKNDSLLEAAQSLLYKGNNKSYSALNKFIIEKKDSEVDYFDYTSELWKKTSLANPKKYWLYAAGENASKWEEFHTEGIIGLGWDALGDLDNYKTKDEIQAKLQEIEGVTNSKKNDTTANYDFYKTISVGDVIIAKKGTSELLGYGIVVSDYYYDEERNTNQKCRKVDWKLKGNWKLDFSLPIKTLTDITKYPSEDPTYNKYYEKLMSIMEEKTIILRNEKAISNLSLNQILHGPPGTGKTYNTINKALLILENKTPQEISAEDRSDLKLRFDEYLKNGQIIFTTFHQSMSYEDFIEGIKPLKPEEEDEFVKYDIQEGIFKKICRQALKEFYKNGTNDETFERLNSFEDAWNNLLENVQESIDRSEVFPLKTKSGQAMDAFEISDKGNLYLRPQYEGAKDYTVSHNRAQKLFEAFPNLEIVNNIDKEFRSVIGGANSTAYWSILNYIINWLNENPIIKSVQQKVDISDTLVKFDNKVVKDNIKSSVLNYIIIIDEINRGNVSQIFGELITLIEDDKRLGNDEALEVTLPYSKEKFGVPPNLYIIGTMNTADRSVEALDTALRRRFCFEEIAPNPELIATEGKAKETQGIIEGIDLPNLLATINNRIEVLSSRDYKIGHAYFMKITTLEELKETFKKNIIPLLQEYFYNDYEKIGLVLGKGFFEESKKINKSIFAPFDTSNYIENGKIHHLKTIDEAFDISEAIKHLLGEIKPEETE